MNEKFKISPWEWDEYYPEDMYGKYYPEDVNALVQIEMRIDEYLREQRENRKKNVS